MSLLRSLLNGTAILFVGTCLLVLLSSVTFVLWVISGVFLDGTIERYAFTLGLFVIVGVLSA